MHTVLFVQPAGERGGPEQILLTLARKLSEYGWRPVVAFLADGPYVDEVRDAGIDTRLLGTAARARHVWRWPDAIRRLSDAANDFEAAVVQANGESVAAWSGWAARRSGASSVF